MEHFSRYPIGETMRGVHVFVSERGANISLAVVKTQGSVPYINLWAQVAPEQARAIAADLVRAADFSEGKVAP